MRMGKEQFEIKYEYRMFCKRKIQRKRHINEIPLRIETGDIISIRFEGWNMENDKKKKTNLISLR